MNLFFLGFIFGAVSFGIAAVIFAIPRVGPRDAPQAWDVVALVQSDGRWTVKKWTGDTPEVGRRVVLMRRAQVDDVIEDTKQ